MKINLKHLLPGIFLLTFSLPLFANSFREGAKKYKQKKYDEAQSAFTETLVNEPENPALHYNLGNTYYKMKDYQKAEKSYLTALNYSEKKVIKQKIYYNLGNTYFKQGKLKEAILFYRKALELNPEDEDARKNLAFAMNLLKKMKKQIQKTQQKLQQMAQSNPQKGQKGEKEKQEKKKGKEQSRSLKKAEKEKVSKEAAEMILNNLEDKPAQRKMKRRRGRYEIDKNW